ncbi:MAG TPA: MarR family transcriptional regulator [Candidatus Krumholzibacteria bacterium]|nr:MarR family transcriptional regulator [Candidatus Krumholzibacteria bacterium]
MKSQGSSTRTSTRTTTRRPRPRAARSPEHYELDNVLRFMRTLWAIDHQLRVRSKRMHSDLGLTGPQRLVVRIVGKFPGISAGAVAGILDIHPSTLTEILQQLEYQRFVQRAIDPNDRRRSLLSLTTRGRRIDKMHAGTVESAVRRALASIPKNKLAVTEEVLRMLAHRLTPV